MCSLRTLGLFGMIMVIFTAIFGEDLQKKSYYDIECRGTRDLVWLGSGINNKIILVGCKAGVQLSFNKVWC